MVDYLPKEKRSKGEGIVYWKKFNELIESVPMERFEKALKEYFKRHGHL